MKKLVNFTFAICAVFLMALAVLTPFGVSAGTIAVGTGILGGVSYKLPNFGLNSGLNKEIWLPDLMEGFYADDMFVSQLRDMSAFVDNDTINLAEAGVNPDVLINNTVYPVPYANRADVPLALPLDTYDTENTLIQSIEIAELAYDKRSSIVYGHKQALRMTFMQKAAHAIAPAANTTFTPILTTTGTANTAGNKKITFSDIMRLQLAFNQAEIPSEGRVIVLSATHMYELMEENLPLYNQVSLSGMLYGFKVYSLADSRLPRYNKTTGAKIAYGAVATPATDVFATIAFHKDEVMRAQGTQDMFAREKDPELRGDMVGFQMRGVALPIRNKGIAAIRAVAA